ncbi:sugar transferase [Cohaesibacter gelatinilyticus]|uniref:Sugar transferase involved in LPS biosynthesis (Colanic, teichoic acid) n=1 Tax=Cohaesibacter gelatinilyticus TaxID=372072 RepID=A0A285PFU5_9HYPH|nr:sugar transferase [Cohaesibacter gelatinilyticus]SNZ20163.1 Sugar transferase involved in LPS biosynthesis (colanic, teichoic acid) [Cohaesibacter gelatinilyticus]
MRIIVTEATEPVGSYLVQHLVLRGHQLLLVGTNPAQLKALFPTQPIADFCSISAQNLQSFDACIHLATHKPNGQQSTFNDHKHALLSDFYSQLYQAGINRQICISSVSTTATALSDGIESEHRLESILQTFDQKLPDWHLTFLHIGQTRTTGNGGKYSLPAMMQAAFKPAVSRELVMETIDQVLVTPVSENETFITLTDRQIDNHFYILTRWLVDHAFVLSILCLGWLFPILYILVKLDSPGPVIFSQQRVGKDGKLFMCHKFRSMQVGTQDVPTHELPPLTVTKMGNFFRKTKLDELPQIWNILRGEMTLIGPRPCLPTQEELLSCRKALGVLDVLPGLTGYAQANKIDMSNPKLLARADNDYINRRSLFLDLKIALKTVFG